MHVHKKIGAMGLAAAMMVSTSAVAVGHSSYGIQITGYVPVVCRVMNSTAIADASGSFVELGEVVEFCNNPTGYQVWLDHMPGADAVLHVDGESIPLSEDGSTLISVSSTAALQRRNLSLELGEDSQLTSVSMRIVAL